MQLESSPHKRKMDTSNGDARRAVKETLAQFSSWRIDLARFAVLAERQQARRTARRFWHAAPRLKANYWRHVRT